MIRCPSTGQPCHHEVCLGWPCDPSFMAALEKAPRMPEAVTDPVTESDTETVTETVDLGTDEPPTTFQIDDDDEPDFTST